MKYDHSYTANAYLLGKNSENIRNRKIVDMLDVYKYVDEENTHSSFEEMSRTEYLEWVSNWKKLYKDLSEDIRILKNLRKPSNLLDFKARLKVNEFDGNPVDKVSYCKRQARVLLNIRRMAKFASAEKVRRINANVTQ